MELAKALILTETHCYDVALNRVYQNPPFKVTFLDCIAAKRRLPCSLCAARSKRTLVFPAPLLPPGMTLSPFKLPPPIDAVDPAQKKLKLSKKENDAAESALVTFAETVRCAERKNIAHQNRPKSAFFPSSLIKAVLKSLLSLESRLMLDNILGSWTFASKYTEPLFAIIQRLQRTFRAERETARLNKNAKQRTTRKSKKSGRSIDSEDELEKSDELENTSGSDDEDDEAHQHPRSSPIPPPAKRSKPALVEVTNQRRPTRPRLPKKGLESAATVTESYGPQYRTSRRRAVEN